MTSLGRCCWPGRRVPQSPDCLSSCHIQGRMSEDGEDDDKVMVSDVEVVKSGGNGAGGGGRVNGSADGGGVDDSSESSGVGDTGESLVYRSGGGGVNIVYRSVGGGLC